MSSVLQDVRHTLRALWRRPAFSLTVIVTLATAIGANTAIFTIVNTVLLKPLPYTEPGQLVKLGQMNPAEPEAPAYVSLPNFVDWQEDHTAFQGLAAWPAFPFRGLTLTGDGDPEELETGYVSGEFFQVLGAELALGRPFTAADDHAGRNQVVVLSDELWRGRFGGDSGIVGRRVLLDDASYLVAGVAAPTLELPAATTDIWAPLSLIDTTRIQHSNRGMRWLHVVGRVADDHSVLRASDVLSARMRELEERYPDDNRDWSAIAARPLRDAVVGRTREPVLIIFGAVGLIFLLAGVNVAGLVLVHGVARSKELSIRVALGATRGRITRLLIIEGAVLGIGGGLLALLLLQWIIAGIVSLGGSRLPRVGELAIDWRIVLFGLGLSLLAGAISTLAPALLALRGTPASRINDVARGGTASRATRRFQGSLVIAEMALAIVLVIGAGLLLRTIWRVNQVDLGFEPSGVLLTQYVIPPTRYPNRADYLAAYDRVLQQVRSMPGLEDAAAIQLAPGTGPGETVDLLPVGADFSEPVNIQWRTVSPGYFSTLKISLAGGRDFDGSDRGERWSVAIVSHALAARFWPAENPVGQQLISGSDTVTVIGVVNDVRADAQAPLEPVVYSPVQQAGRRRVALLVRTEGDPVASAPLVRAAIRHVDPAQPWTAMRPLVEAMRERTGDLRFLAILLALFAVVAVGLATLGVYGLVSYIVAQLRRDFGIRLALGATSRQLTARMLLWVGRLAFAAVFAGLLMATLLTPLLEGRLFQIAPRDGVTFVAASIIVLALAMLAAGIPALRAARTDPRVALTSE